MKYTVNMCVTAWIGVQVDTDDTNEIDVLASDALGNTDWNKLENMTVTEFDIYDEAGKLIKVC